MKDEDRYQECRQEFQQLQTYKATFSQQCEEVAELVLPTSRNTFYVGSYNFPGAKKTDRQVDASAMMALSRFSAILDSLLTPRNMTWHFLEANNDYVMKQRGVRLYFRSGGEGRFKMRYAPTANFASQNQNVFQSLGAFGNGLNFIDQYDWIDGTVGLRYKSIPFGEMFLRENHQGLVDGFCRWFRLTGPQALQKWKERCPPTLKEAAEKSSQQPFEFLHRVCPRDDYDGERFDAKGKLYASYYCCLTTSEFISEGGYSSFPLAPARYDQAPGEVYGRGPAMLVLPAIKTLNAEKRDFLTQGHRAASPVLLTTEDGLMSFNMRPGALNNGGMSPDGKPLVGILPTGDISVTKEMMDEERGLIESAFLVDLFKILLGDPKIFTATQIVEMMAQRGILIAPQLGRQQSEYLGAMIPREIDLLSQMRIKGRPVLPEMPAVLREAGGEYQIVYASPLARDQRSQEVAGFQRTLSTAAEVANVTGDPSVFDSFDFDVALPEISKIQAVPESWMAGPEAIAAKKQQRAQAAQQQMEIQAAPAQAAMMKAGAARAKAGLPEGVA
jgi:hypothetical protein